VAHHASDVDPVGGSNESVLLPHGLRQHLSPERFVKVRRGGKVPGDVDLAFLLGMVDAGWRASRIGIVDAGWRASCIDSVRKRVLRIIGRTNLPWPTTTRKGASAACRRPPEISIASSGAGTL